jgi:thioredoxin-like negative regulator of GroEL
MHIFRFVALLVGLLAVSAVTEAQAASVATFTEQAFKAAQADGRPILVDISATWCPICAQQKPIIDGLATRPEFSGLVILHVDFDAQKDVVRAFGAHMQSTLIVFHGAERKGESVGDTDADSIKALLEKSLS